MAQAAPEATLVDRCRMNHIATSIIALSQGIPFFHAGDELLRSKVSSESRINTILFDSLWSRTQSSRLPCVYNCIYV